MEFLYRKDASTNKEAFQFLKNQKKLCSTLQMKLGMKTEELKGIYALLQLSDAFSLLLCQEQIPPENRWVEISKGPNHLSYQFSQFADGVLIVDPWPFEQKSFTVYFESRCLKKLEFSDSAEFRKAFIDSSVKETIWEIRKKPVHYKKGIK